MESLDQSDPCITHELHINDDSEITLSHSNHRTSHC